MTPSTRDLLDIMYQALAEPIGLLISTSDVRRCQAAFYKARQNGADAALQVLQIKLSPVPGGDLIIIRAEARQP